MAVPPQARTVSDVGEAGTIAAIRAAAPSALNGDDAAVLAAAAPNARQVCTTDILVEGQHFSLDWSTPGEVGTKAVTQNFADIQAMGARPTAVLMSLAVPGETPVDVVRGIARGIGTAASPWAAELVGGDVVRSTQLIISLTALGVLAGPDPALTIDGAAPGHTVIASGPLGHSAAGLALLRHFGRRDRVPDDEILQRLVQWHCAPTLTVGRGSVARATGASSMTDNSDGLIRDVTTLAERSGVIIDLDSAAIEPDADLRHAAEVLDVDPWTWVLGGGEDHTLIGTTAFQTSAGYRTIGRALRVPDTDPNVDDGVEQHVLVDGAVPAVTTGWSSL
ncbi:thiamine-phosphate kinase [Corynebacterium bovis]